MTRKSCAVGMRNAILRNHLTFLWPLLIRFDLAMNDIFCSKWSNYYPTWRHSTNWEWEACRTKVTHFCAKYEAWRNKMFHIFPFLHADTVLGTVNLHSQIFNAISSEKSCRVFSALPSCFILLLSHVLYVRLTVFWKIKLTCIWSHRKHDFAGYSMRYLPRMTLYTYLTNERYEVRSKKFVLADSLFKKMNYSFI